MNIALWDKMQHLRAVRYMILTLYFKMFNQCG